EGRRLTPPSARFTTNRNVVPSPGDAVPSMVNRRSRAAGASPPPLRVPPVGRCGTVAASAAPRPPARRLSRRRGSDTRYMTFLAAGHATTGGDPGERVYGGQRHR